MSLTRVRAVLATLAFAVLVVGCDDASRDLFPDKDTIGVPVGAVTHYGTGIEVDEVFIDSFRGGYYRGWGATNPGICCVLLPRRTPQEPMYVTVKWTTFRINVKEEIRHEARVPINFAVDPGKSGGLFVHFLPGHRVEVWVSPTWPYGADYPGPRLDGVSPAYQPLRGELPEPPLGAPTAQEEPASTSSN